MTKERFIHELLPLKDKLFRFACRILCDKELARDMVQNVYLKLWNIRCEMNSINNKEAFAIRMIKNMCLDKIKMTKNNAGILEVHRTCEHTYEKTEAVLIIKKLIAALPKQQRLIIELRDINGYSYEEIAESLNTSINTIRVVLSRARKTVRDEFEKIYNYGIRYNKTSA